MQVELRRCDSDIKHISGPVLNGKGASLKVDEERGLRVEGASLCGLADTAGAEHRDVHLGCRLQSFIGSDEAELGSLVCAHGIILWWWRK